MKLELKVPVLDKKRGTILFVFFLAPLGNGTRVMDDDYSPLAPS